MSMSLKELNELEWRVEGLENEANIFLDYITTLSDSLNVQDGTVYGSSLLNYREDCFFCYVFKRGPILISIIYDYCGGSPYTGTDFWVLNDLDFYTLSDIPSESNIGRLFIETSPYIMCVNDKEVYDVIPWMFHKDFLEEVFESWRGDDMVPV